MRRPVLPPNLRGRPYATAVTFSSLVAGLFIAVYGVAIQLAGPADIPLSVLAIDLAAALGCLLLAAAGWRGHLASPRRVEWCAVASVTLILASVVVEIAATPSRVATLTAHCFIILLAAGVVVRTTLVLLTLSAVALASWGFSVALVETPPGFDPVQWLPTWAVAILISLLAHAVVSIERAVEQDVLSEVESTSWVDPLTDLANRHGFTTQAGQVVASARRRHDTVWCAFVDVNRFKTVNDVFGHTCGDGVLVEVAHALRATVRDCDVAARWGGDEFVILGAGGPPAERDLQTRITDHLATALDPSITDLWTPQVTVGVEAVRVDGSDPTTALLLAADRRMYARRLVERATDDVQVAAENRTGSSG